MTATLLIARRELAAYLRTWSGYAIIAAALFIEGLVFNVWALGGDQGRLSGEVLAKFFYLTSGFVMTASVFLSMRLLAEERQTGTVALLYSSPIRDRDIVLGKFISALIFLAVMLVLTMFMPALIMVNGKISMGQVAAGYLGVFLLGSASLAIGIVGSALTRSQVVAAIISGGILVAFIFFSNLARVTDRPIADVFSALGIWDQHFPPFQQGLIHLRDVIYYLVVTYVALFAATRVLEARRWR